MDDPLGILNRPEEVIDPSSTAGALGTLFVSTHIAISFCQVSLSCAEALATTSHE